MTTPPDVEPAVTLAPAASGPLAAAEQLPAGAAPPVLAGTYAIYEDGRGGFVLVADSNGEVHRKHIPAAMVKLMTGAGPLAHIMRKLGPVPSV